MMAAGNARYVRSILFALFVSGFDQTIFRKPAAFDRLWWKLMRLVQCPVFRERANFSAVPRGHLLHNTFELRWYFAQQALEHGRSQGSGANLTHIERGRSASASPEAP